MDGQGKFHGCVSWAVGCHALWKWRRKESERMKEREGMEGIYI